MARYKVGDTIKIKHIDFSASTPGRTVFREEENTVLKIVHSKGKPRYHMKDKYGTGFTYAPKDE